MGRTNGYMTEMAEKFWTAYKKLNRKYMVARNWKTAIRKRCFPPLPNHLRSSKSINVNA
jgi:hypothetical protein